jgi:predicted ester cyclase
VDGSSSDAIRELAECLYAALDRRDWSTVEELVSPRLVVHIGSSAPTSFDGWRADQDAFHRGFPDGRHVIEQILVIGSHCVSVCRFVGTHTGEFHELAPTGTKVSVGAIHIDRFQGDRLVEHRGQLDLHSLVQQLRTGPPPHAPN